jgi:hypothetical protein
MALHTPNYDIRGGAYCGPTAIAAITGQPISVIREVIRTQIGTKANGHAMPVMGVSNKDLLATMATLGWRVIAESGDAENESNRRDIFRFGDFLDYVQMHEHAGPYIVNVTGHYYAVDSDEICDTHLQIPIEIHRFKRGRRRWVKRWWQFEKSGGGGLDGKSNIEPAPAAW